jgi:hypothetical protein
MEEKLERLNASTLSYRNWSEDALRQIALIAPPRIPQGAMIQAQYTQLRDIQNKFSSTSAKMDKAREFRDQYLEQQQFSPEQYRVLEVEIGRLKSELSSELTDIKQFDISPTTKLREIYEPIREEMEKALKLADEKINYFKREEKNFNYEYDNSVQYIEQRLTSMTPAERLRYQTEFYRLINLMKSMRAQFKDVTDGLQKRWHQVYDPIITDLSAAKKLAQKVERIHTDLISQYERDLRTLDELLESAKTREHMPSAQIVRQFPKLDDPPVVRIFETQPAVIDLSLSYRQIQQTIFAQLRAFQWGPTKMPEKTACGTNELNNAQKIAYHAVTPFNGGVNVALIHSTGSGKTATGRLIMSLFVRAGFDVIIVAPRKIKDDLINAALKNGADFNVQQYTSGERPKDVILNDLMIRSKGRFATVKDLTDMLDSCEFTADELRRATFDDKEVEACQRKAEEKERAKKARAARKGKIEASSEEEEEEQQESYLMINLKTYLFDNILKHDMKMRQYKKPTSSLTYQELSNLTLKKAKGQEAEFFETQSQWSEERKLDRLFKVFLLIDEAHNLVAENSTLKGNDKPDFLSLRNALHKSYRFKIKNPNYQSARVALLTATPVVNHALDAINLCTLLAIPDEKSGFGNYGDIDNNRKQMEDLFMKNEWDSQAKKFRNVDKIKQFFAGHFSYANLLGDVGIMPQPVYYENGQPVANPPPNKSPVQYSPINLTVLQQALVGRCFEKHSGSKLKMSKDKAMYIVQNTAGTFDYDDATGSLIPRSIPKVEGKKINVGGSKKPKTTPKKTKPGSSETVEETEVGKDETLSCISQNVVWPWLTKTDYMITAKELNEMSSEEVKAFVESGRLQEFSPLIVELIKNLRKNEDQAVRMLSEYYRLQDNLEDRGLVAPRDPERDYRNYKTLIYVDVKHGSLGTEPIAQILTAFGYQRLNRPGQPLQKSKVPYRGFYVLDDKINREDKNEKNTIVTAFNDHESNFDGREAIIMLVSSQYREGLSLEDIFFEEILGFLTNDADLQQAIARGIRYCSRARSPFIPSQGHTVNIRMYTPAFGGTTPMNSTYPLQLYDILNPERAEIELAKKAMMAIIKEVAFDKDLLRTINAASEQVDNAVKLWFGRK